MPIPSYVNPLYDPQHSRLIMHQYFINYMLKMALFVCFDNLSASLFFLYLFPFEVFFLGFPTGFFIYIRYFYRRYFFISSIHEASTVLCRA